MSLKDDINKTIEYAKSYGCVLNNRQIWQRMIGKKVYKNPFSSLTSSAFDKGYMVKNANKIAEILSKKFTNILFIGITGSVAAEFPKKNDDIDLLIITKKNTLWITRFWVRLYIWKHKIPHRKYGKPQNKNEFCFNMWLDEIGLELPNDMQNLKNAVDLILMKNIYNKDDTYLKFLKVNKWAKKYVATPYSCKFLIENSSKDNITNYHIKDYRLLNLFYFLFQFLYLKMKKQKDLVDLHRAMWGKEKYNSSNGYE